MTAPERAVSTLPAGFVRLVAAERIRAEAAAIATLLSAERPWPALRAEPSPMAGLRRFGVDLALRLGGDGGGLTTLRKAAYLDLGAVVPNENGWSVEIGWQASSAAPLFPVFGGRLTIEPDEMSLDGIYAPPGGAVGRVADRMLLHVAANGTARWLLREIDRAALGGR